MSVTPRVRIAAMAAGTATLMLAAWAHADSHGEAVVEYRQGVMSAIGGNTSAIAASALQGAGYEGNLETHARQLVELTEDIPALFPEGSNVGETWALDAVWEDRAGFEERAQAASEAAQDLYDAVQAGDQAAIAQRFQALGQACKACHDNYRAE